LLSRSVEIPLAADRSDPVPLTGQIVSQLRVAMTEGPLSAGERLPSTRSLAAALGVSRTVVTSAYAQLFAEGWIEGRHGSGTYVAEGAAGRGGAGTAGTAGAAGGGTIAAGTASLGTVCGHPAGGRPASGHPASGHPAGSGWRWPADADADASTDAEVIELRPGIPWAAGIDRAAWRRAWRAAGAGPPLAAGQPRGTPALRGALTGYLRRSRGFRCGPEQILITQGVASSLGLIAVALLRPGDRVGVEEPGYPAARAVFTALGARLVPCPVDAGGLVVDALPAGLRLIYTTPAHQYPLGGRLPVPRRQALIAWAHASGALIIEDDYDGEFRYDVAPLPALFGLDQDVVVYLGTTTKTLTPELRVGWLVARPDLVSQLADVSAGMGGWAGGAAQRAVLTLVGAGDLEQHIRRMRHEYARRRAALTGALTRADAGPLLGDEAGMHIVLRTRRDAAAVAMQARQCGVAVATLTRYFAGPVTVNGLVLGYGGATTDEIARACQLLAPILAAEEPASAPASAASPDGSPGNGPG
jgi:GntR family transcriptional regulator/MocR family aminotransferase